MMGARVRATQDPCWLTLGAADVLTGRGVRLHALAPHVDALGLQALPQDMPLRGDALDAARVLFVLRLAQRLAAPDANDGAVPAMFAVTGISAQPISAEAGEG